MKLHNLMFFENATATLTDNPDVYELIIKEEPKVIQFKCWEDKTHIYGVFEYDDDGALDTFDIKKSC